MTDIEGHLNGKTPPQLDDDFFIDRSLESGETDDHCVVSRWKAGIDDQPLIIGYAEHRPDQRGAVELDLGSRYDATRLVSYDDTESTDLLLRDDRSGHCTQADDREPWKSPTPFSYGHFLLCMNANTSRRVFSFRPTE